MICVLFGFFYTPSDAIACHLILCLFQAVVMNATLPCDRTSLSTHDCSGVFVRVMPCPHKLMFIQINPLCGYEKPSHNRTRCYRRWQVGDGNYITSPWTGGADKIVLLEHLSTL